jgi:hypothetical protein
MRDVIRDQWLLLRIVGGLNGPLGEELSSRLNEAASTLFDVARDRDEWQQRCLKAEAALKQINKTTKLAAAKQIAKEITDPKS